MQGAMVLRVLSYWLLVVLLLAGVSCAQVLLAGGEAPWPVLLNRCLQALGPSLIALLMILPLLLLDSLRFSHRFAGPMGRLRREVGRLADGQWQGALRFRKGDYWHTLADEINRVAARLKVLESSTNSPQTDPKLEDASV